MKERSRREGIGRGEYPEDVGGGLAVVDADGKSRGGNRRHEPDEADPGGGLEENLALAIVNGGEYIRTREGTDQRERKNRNRKKEKGKEEKRREINGREGPWRRSGD